MSSRNLRSGKNNVRNNTNDRGGPQPTVRRNENDGAHDDDGPPNLTPNQPLLTSTPNASVSMAPPSERPMAHAFRKGLTDASKMDERVRSRSNSSNRSRSSSIRRLELEVAAEKRKMALDEEEANIKLQMIAAKRAREEVISTRLQEIAEHEASMNYTNDNEDSLRESAPPGDMIPSWFEKHFQPSPRKNENVTNREQSNFMPPSTEQRAVAGEGGAYLEKFLARQTVGTKLPQFNGSPHEWPMFFSQFKHSTKICGLTDHENMLRLQEALKGKARDAVESVLGFPENVEMVMEMLQMNFGRDDQIVKSLISKAKLTTSPRDGQPDTVIAFYNSVNNMVSTMQKLRSDTYLNNPSLLEELVQKLSPQMKSNWAMHVLDKNGENNLAIFASWLKRWAMAQAYLPSSEAPAQIEKGGKKSSAAVLSTTTSNNNLGVDTKDCEAETKTAKSSQFTCTFCNIPRHGIDQCRKFQNLNVNERWKFVKQKRCCFLCLRRGHLTRDCRSNVKCSHNGCTGSHHSLLHNPKKTTDDPKPTENVMCAAALNEALLKIVPVTLNGPNGEVKTFALLDEGSTVTLMDDAVAAELGLDGAEVDFTFRGVNATPITTKSKLVKLKITTASVNQPFQLQNVKTVANLSLPVQSVKIGKKIWPHLQNINIDQYRFANPKILIGQDHVDLIVSREVRQGPSNAPVASKTKLGWVLHGNYSRFGSETEKIMLTDDRMSELHEMVKSYFKMEQLEPSKCIDENKSREDKIALKIMNDTAVHTGKGWMIGLPWRNKNVTFPESRKQAERRLKHIETKLSKDEMLAKRYNEKIEDHVRKGYIRKLNPVEAAVKTNKTFYLPHFAVVNPNKPDKIRVVWDAAARSNGTSLNDQLLTGPDYYNPLPGVLFKFRQRAIASSADIEEMFLRIEVCPEDCHAQRFLWRGEVYEITRVLFGSVSSPSQAQYVKNRNALMYEQQHPQAAEAIIKRHYMDDYLDSFDTVDEAIRIINEVIYIHSEGGFKIRNWVTSHPEVLRHLPEDMIASGMKTINDDNCSHVERVLGVRWNHINDNFNFDVKFHKVPPDVISHTKKPTKREVLQLMSSIFDPLGFISNFHVRGKILLQNIWKSGTGWDDVIEDDLDEMWSSWLDQMKDLSTVTIPRFYGFPPESKLQLNVFCDASNAAYAAVAYLRCEATDGVKVAYVMSKTRVAPLKPMTIPRLELMAALIGSRMANFIKQYHDINIETTIMWSDSQTVLRWIRSDANRYKTFVANRLGEIDELTNVDQWRWVPSKENVADDATRADTNADVSVSSRWFNGPEFLHFEQSQWPKEKIPETLTTDGVNEVIDFVHVVIPTFPILPDATRFSSYMKLIRVTAWVLRYIEKCKKKLIKTKELTIPELVRAEKIWWKNVQWICFPNEMYALTNGNDVSTSSSIKSLCPSLDSEGIMRMNSRMKNNATLLEQVILSRHHEFTRLLTQHYHVINMHIGQETVVHTMRQKYWIPALRSLVKSIQFKCVRCKNLTAKPTVPIMGLLPQARLTPYVKPFHFTGMDYFGPIMVRVGRKYDKQYGVIFSCLTTRAIHLEIAEKLNTDSAVMAIRRLVALRGKVDTIWSDNGRNLVGAEREMKILVKSLDENDFQRHLASKQINWKFNPPAAPHMGGAWEKLIQSVKRALRAVLSKQVIRQEALRTLLAEVSHTVNSRPLTHVSVDPNDPEAITPNQLLMGMETNVVANYEYMKQDLKRQWIISQKFADNFWRRWIKEYRPSIIQRTKWQKKVPNLTIGDIVILVDDTLPRNAWPMGKIIRLYPGRDGIVRIVDVKTIHGTYRRSVSKLCLLDIRST